MRAARLRTHRQRSSTAVLAGVALLAGVVASAAQNFPERTVRIVAPAAAGGALDLISRILAQKVGEIWNKPVFVEDKPGANMMIGMDTIAKSEPDGYNILVVSSSAITVNPYVFSNMPLDPFRDLAPVMTTTITPYALLLNRNVPAKSVAEFIAYLKANPGKLNHASNSAATMLVSELFKTRAGVEYVDINYKGASQAINDTIGGHTQFCFVDLGSASVAIKGQTLTPLAISTPERFQHFPDIPVFTEDGLPGFSVMGRTVLAAPAKTPSAIMAKLNAAFLKALASPDVADRLQGMGQIVGGGAPQETVDILRAEAREWEVLIKERGIRFDQ